MRDRSSSLIRPAIGRMRPGAVSGRRTRRRSTASRSDRYRLYEASVQDAAGDAAFLDDEFLRRRRRRPASFREDFCGTAALACEFAARRRRSKVFAVDRDPEPLAWGTGNHLSRMSRSERRRVRFVESDVLDWDGPPVDLIAAMNFSYWIFETRELLRTYFEQVRRALNPDGLFFMDAYGGFDCHEEKEYAREEDGFTFIWDQVAFDPISGHMKCAIHYEFPDGSRLRNAFRYEWRFWSLPELRELLVEAGFSRTVILWEGADEHGEGTGVFEEVTVGTADATWIAYLVSEP